MALTTLTKIGKGITSLFKAKGATHARELEDRFSDIINVKDYGAIGDGEADDTAAFKAAIQEAKVTLKTLYAPSGVYLITDQLKADFALCMYGDGSGGVSGENHNTPTQGTELLFRGTTYNYGLEIGSDSVFSFGLTLKDFALVAEGMRDTGTAWRGLRLHNVGWTGLVYNVRIDNFKQKGLELGYIQDTHFIGCTIVSCGTEGSANYAIDFINDSNYVYFDHCRIEECSYMINSQGGAWEVYFENVHFETGDYPSPSQPNYSYSDYPVRVGEVGQDGSRWHFTSCTFVPSSVGTLKLANGGDDSSQPQFISFKGSFCSVVRCTGINPQGVVDYFRLLGYTYSHHVIDGCTLSGCNPDKATYVTGGTVSNSEFYFSHNGVKLLGIYIDYGTVRGCYFSSDSGGSVKSSGEFIDTANAASVEVSNCRFDLGTKPFRYLNELVSFNGEGLEKDWYIVSNNEVVDLRSLHPTQDLILTDNSTQYTIANVVGSTTGRKLKIYNNSSATHTLNFNLSHIQPKGNSNLSLSPYSMYVFEADSAGILIQVS